MSEIIGHDTDGTPIQAGALVTHVDLPDRVFDGPLGNFRVDRGAYPGMDMLLNLTEPKVFHWIHREGGRWMPDCAVRVIKDDHEPADEEFTEQLKQTLKQEDKQCQS